MRDYRGNTSVAYQMEPQPKKTAQTKRLSQTGFPAGEKLLYLASLILCVALASGILSRYAEAAEINLKLQQVERRVAAVEEANQAYQERIHALKSGERIRRFAEENGMIRMEKQSPGKIQRGKQKAPVRGDGRG
ncbi:hypothetical protein GCM10007416_01430 [Kroppenstedtia guangzhouensis]|jgi:cell division protein FtsL|uniref:Cell division protein FtsL n=1 Tax=Kroppenstedtia guangzhouensis TaxID=1274356 RepID=A0ABQ1FWE7_9BACL|nr:hypothetical protein [Kroppenstedtia guangzhouensis]GGA32557.1 hypothetical protein GCM10007416_01430 [Kroppenstedtia guangzhouensis]